MRYTTLGSTGLFVSEPCLGTTTFGRSGMRSAIGAVGQVEADAIVVRAFAAGINFIDTADTSSDCDADRITVILGAKRLDQLDDTLGVIGIALSAEDLPLLDVSRQPAQYPGWVLEIWSDAWARQLGAMRGAA